MSSLAKLSRPRLATVHPRERLFALLDGARRNPVVWVFGPPGAGKTSLLASYIEARQLRVLWYQVDAGDADPATFFYYLREADPARPQAPLPLLTAEYLHDVAGFSRRFFRALFERLPTPSLVVLDNFQEAPHASPFQGIIRDAVSELPQGINLIALSRTEPPAEWARLHTNHVLTAVGWNELRLTTQETEAIVSLHGGGRESEALALHKRAGAWAAGLTLLLQSTGQALRLPNTLNVDVPEAIFGYLAAEVFERAPMELRTLWLCTACLPRFTTAMAERLSGNSNATRLLDELCRARYFTERHADAPPTYQYHALFQEFLQHQLRRSYSVAEQQQLAHRSARLLEAHGDHEAALAMYREVGDWASAEQLILRQAPALVALGRAATLEGWIARLPRAAVEEAPWLQYWIGSCRAQTGSPGAGRQILVEVYAKLVAAMDLTGQALTIAAIIDTYVLEYDEFKNLDPWIDALLALLVLQATFPSPSMELQVKASLLIALSNRRPEHPQASMCAERVWALCRTDVTDGEKFMAAGLLLNYLMAYEGMERVHAIVAEFGPLDHSPHVTPMQRVAWRWSLTMYVAAKAEHERVQQAFRESWDLATAHGLSYLFNFLRLFALWGPLAAGDLVAAASELEVIAVGIDGARPNDVAMYHFLRAWLASAQKHPRLALEHAQRAVEVARRLGNLAPFHCCLNIHSYALAECGELARALSVAREASAGGGSTDNGMIRFTALVFEADVLLRLGHADFLVTLRAAFTCGRVGGFRGNMVWLPAMMSRLCAAALEAGIETEYVRQLIRWRGLTPERTDIEDWPWPVRIYTFDRLTVELDGEPLAFRGKVQKRPLELLAAVLAQGGQGATTAALIEHLWPDLDGDAAHNAFSLALHRLRKLLKRDDVLRMQDGQLHLNADLVWLDITAFERRCAAVERSDAEQAAPAGRAAMVGQLLSLYTGHFLASEDASWVIGARERLRSKFLRSVSTIGLMLERAGAWHELSSLYRRALELAPLVEEFHRGLMVSYKAQGSVAEALDAYRRCRELLTAVGVEPSALTLAVYRSLKGDAA